MKLQCTKEMLEGVADKNGMSNFIFDPSLFISLRRRCFCNLKPLFSTQDIPIVMTLSILRLRKGFSVNMTSLFCIIQRTVTNRTYYFQDTFLKASRSLFLSIVFGGEPENHMF